MSVIHSTKSSFQQDVLDKKGVVLVDFFAEWCGPCKMVGPIIEELSTSMKNVTFVKVDVDKSQDLAGNYSVFSIPTFMIFKDGKVVEQFVGAQSKETFKEKLSNVISS